MAWEGQTAYVAKAQCNPPPPPPPINYPWGNSRNGPQQDPQGGVLKWGGGNQLNDRGLWVVKCTPLHTQTSHRFTDSQIHRFLVATLCKSQMLATSEVLLTGTQSCMSCMSCPDYVQTEVKQFRLMPIHISAICQLPVLPVLPTT